MQINGSRIIRINQSTLYSIRLTAVKTFKGVALDIIIALQVHTSRDPINFYANQIICNSNLNVFNPN